MKPVLFHHPLARSGRVVHLLNEMGKIDQVDIKVLNILQGEHKTSEELFKINPQSI